MKTKLELQQSASRTATATLEETNPANLRIAAANAANADGVEPVDYADWENFFTASRRVQLQLRNQPTASEVIRQREAKNPPTETK